MSKLPTPREIFEQYKSESTIGLVGYRVGRAGSSAVIAHVFPLHKCDNCGAHCVIDEGVELELSPDASEVDVARIFHNLGAVQTLDLNRGGYADNDAQFECDACTKETGPQFTG